MRVLTNIIIFVLISSPCLAATEFISKICNTGSNCTDEDYNTCYAWEAIMDNATNLTDGTVKCGAFTCTGGTCNAANIIDSEAVTWDSGASTGTLIHLTGSQYMIDVSTGTLDATDIVDDGESNTFTADAVDSCIVVAELYDDDGDINEGSTSCEINFGSATYTDATNYVVVRAAVAERHNGNRDTGPVIKLTGGCNRAPIWTEQPYTVIEWLQAESLADCAGSGAHGIQLRALADNSIVRNNILIEPTQPVSADGIDIDATNKDSYVYNNIVIGAWSNGINIDYPDGGNNTYVYNNTVYGATIGIDCFDSAVAGTIHTINNISMGNTTDFDSNCDMTYNMSSDTTSTGTGALVSQTASDQFVSLTGGSEDLHLKNASDALSAGTDLSGTFTNDIDNDTRSDWDMGADECASCSLTVASGSGQGVSLKSIKLKSIKVN